MEPPSGLAEPPNQLAACRDSLFSPKKSLEQETEAAAASPRLGPRRGRGTGDKDRRSEGKTGEGIKGDWDTHHRPWKGGIARRQKIPGRGIPKASALFYLTHPQAAAGFLPQKISLRGR